MHKLIELIEKGKPFFEKISRNIYLRAIRDGFIAGMPVILFSSIFILIAYVPNAWGFHWSKGVETFLMTPYSYSMGILAFFVGGTTAKALTDSINRDLPATNQINFLSTMLASMVGFLLMAAEPAKETQVNVVVEQPKATVEKVVVEDKGGVKINLQDPNGNKIEINANEPKK